MKALLRFIDSSPYFHARTYAEIPREHRDTLETAAAHRYVTHGRFGYVLTTRGFYHAWPDFTAGDGTC